MTYYTINSADVSSEYFESEVLAINLKSGNYFSLRATAFVFWKLIQEGNSLESSIFIMSNHFAVEEAKATQLFTNFTEQLIANELITKTDNTAVLPNNDWIQTLDFEFTAPQLESYTDMQDLLLFDPIHDVDTQVGWPKKADEDATN